MLVRAIVVGLGLVGAVALATAAEEQFKAEALEENPPEALSSEIRATLQDNGLRLLQPDGSVLCDVWLSKQAELLAEIWNQVRKQQEMGGIVESGA